MRVIFYVGDEEYEIGRIGQYGVMPDVTIDLVRSKRKER